MKKIIALFLISFAKIACSKLQPYEEIAIVAFDCADKIEIADAFEPRQLNNIQIPNDLFKMSAPESFKLAIFKWSLYSLDMANYFADYYHQVFSQAKMINGTVIDIDFEKTIIARPKNCLTKTLIYSQVSKTNESIFLDKNLWDRLNDFQKTLAIHGMFLQRESAFAHINNSQKNFSLVDHRNFNAFFWSNEFDNKSLKYIMNLFSKLNPEGFLLNGINFNLDHPYKFWDENILASGFNVYTNNDFKNKLKSNVYGQNLKLGLSTFPNPISFYPNGQFKCINLDSGQYYKTYHLGKVLEFSSDWSKQLCFYPNGKILSGYLHLTTQDQLNLVTPFVDAKIESTYIPPGSSEKGTAIGFFEDRQLEYATGAIGQVYLQKKWFNFKNGLILRNDGSVYCAHLLEGQRILNEDRLSILLKGQNTKYCFNKNGLLLRDYY